MNVIYDIILPINIPRVLLEDAVVYMYIVQY